MATTTTAVTVQEMQATLRRFEIARGKLDEWMLQFGDWNRDEQEQNVRDWIASRRKLADLVTQIKADRDEAIAAWDAMVTVWTNPDVVARARVAAWTPRSEEHPVDGRSRFREWWSGLYQVIVAVNAAR